MQKKDNNGVIKLRMFLFSISLKRSAQHMGDEMFPYQTIALMLVALVVSIIYINKGVKEFGANIVTPSLYIEFVLLSIIGSAIVYKEWNGLDYHSIIAIVLGLLNITIGNNFCYIFV